MQERERTTQVVIYVPRTILDEIDAAVGRAGEKRSAWIVEACRERLERERVDAARQA